MRILAIQLFAVPEGSSGGNRTSVGSGKSITSSSSASPAPPTSSVSSLLGAWGTFGSSSSTPSETADTSGGTGPYLLASAVDVNHLSFFERSAAKEFILFTCRTIARASTRGLRQSVREGSYLVHVYNRRGLCALVCCDDAYPKASAFAFLTKVLDEYTKVEGDSWQSAQQDNKKPSPWLDLFLKDAQDPTNVDKIAKIQSQIEETKAAAETTIRSMLNRGERLEDLAAASGDLSAHTKMFMKNSKDMNKCCKML